MKLTGAEIAIEVLIEQGVKKVFGYPGGQVVNLYDALYRYGDRILHVLTAHEQGAAHAADGYARATGEPGVVIATSGPGATNLVTGIATAMLDSKPLVAITGNVASSLIGRDSFQEIDITGITLPITKHNYFISDVETLADSLREAFQIAKSGRPGPVLIDIPKDVQVAECEFVPAPPQKAVPSPAPKAEAVAEAVKLINRAKRPYLYFGGGVINAGIGDKIERLADKIDAAAGCSLMGLSAIPAGNPRFLGMQGMHGRFASSIAQNEADLIIGVGVRFSDRATGDKSKYAASSKIIHIDVDFAEIDKNVPAAVGVRGDIGAALDSITEKVKKSEKPAWRKRVDELKKEEEAMSSLHTKPRAIIEAINRGAGENTVFVTDVGQHQMWAAQYLKLKTPRTFISSGGLGTMGFGLGAAIGAAFASGERTVLITGDGCFGMNLNELATAVTYNVPVTVVIFNNGVLGMVRQWQSLFFGRRFSQTTLERKTDFVKVAEGFGASASRVGSLGEFEAVFKRSFEADGPCVIDCAIDREELVLPMLPPGGSIDQIIVENKEG